LISRFADWQIINLLVNLLFGNLHIITSSHLQIS